MSISVFLMLLQALRSFEISNDCSRQLATHFDVRCRGQNLSRNPIFDNFSASRMTRYDQCQTSRRSLDQDARYSLAIPRWQADNIALPKEVGHIFDVTEETDLAQLLEIFRPNRIWVSIVRHPGDDELHVRTIRQGTRHHQECV